MSMSNVQKTRQIKTVDEDRVNCGIRKKGGRKDEEMKRALIDVRFWIFEDMDKLE